MPENITELVKDITSRTEGRPWPLPKLPWLMAQDERNLLFIHWPISVKRMRSLVPSQMELDLYDGQAWLTMIAFHMVDLHMRDLPPLPWTSTFPEVDLLTYVRLNDQPGVFFLSIDAASELGGWVARHFFHLPYLSASMEFSQVGDGFHIQSRRAASDVAPAADFAARYKPVGRAFEAKKGTLEYFLVERFVMFSVSPGGIVFGGHEHHLPWKLQRAQAEIEVNTIPRAAGIDLPPAPPLLHFSAGTHDVTWPPLPLCL